MHVKCFENRGGLKIRTRMNFFPFCLAEIDQESLSTLEKLQRRKYCSIFRSNSSELNPIVLGGSNGFMCAATIIQFYLFSSLMCCVESLNRKNTNKDGSKKSFSLPELNLMFRNFPIKGCTKGNRHCYKITNHRRQVCTCSELCVQNVGTRRDENNCGLWRYPSS